MYPCLKVTSSVYGNFGTIITGTFNDIPFKATCEDYNGETICKDIESVHDKSKIGEALVYLGYVNTYEMSKGRALRSTWLLEKDCPDCGKPIATDGSLLWCSSDECVHNTGYDRLID